MMYNQGVYQDTNPSCRHLAFQPAQFNSQSVPPVPQMQDIPPQLQQYIPAMGVTIGNSLAKMAQINPAFIYLSQNAGIAFLSYITYLACMVLAFLILPILLSDCMFCICT